MATDDKDTQDETDRTSKPEDGEQADAEGTAASSSEKDADDEKADAKEADAKKAGAKKADEAEAEETSSDEGSSEPAEKAASEGDAAPERMRRSRARGAKPVSPPPPAASLGRSVVLFVAVFVTLAAGFAFLSSSDPFSERNAPRWRKGQKVQLNITLDPRDDLNLSCASKSVVEGKRCEFEAKNQKYSGEIDDKQLLRPYTTTDGVQFLAAGLWTQPDLEKGKRPRDRFTVACTFTVDGNVGSPAVRWNPAGAWNEKNQNWFAGSVSDCKVQAE